MKTLLSILALCSLAFAQGGSVFNGGNTLSGSQTFSSVANPLTVTTTTLPQGTQGVSYLQNLSAVGGVPCPGNTYVWNTALVSGSLPTGTSLSSAGAISGIPSAAATYTFVVQVQDCATPTPNTANSGTLQIVINPVTPPPPPSQVGENGYCSGTTDASCFTGSQTDTVTSGGVTVTVALPTTGMYTGLDGTPAPGGTVTFTCGGNLQTAINSLTAGQTLVIPAICSAAQDVISGNFTLPVVSGANASNWNIIETDQTGAASFPAEHTQATPCAINQSSVAGYPSYTCSSPAILMPQISCANSGDQSCFTASSAASFWRIIGLEIKQPDTFNNDGNGLIDLTNSADHIIFDRVLMHGPAVACTQTAGVYSCTSHDLKNGIQLQNATNVAVINSWIYDIACPQGTCTDSHAFGGGNGTLPSHTYKVFGNMISAAGENFFQGGGGAVGATNIVTPTDFEIRNNHFFKPVSYALCTGCSGQHVEFKNSLEIKNGQRLLAEGNEFENNWQGWQTDQAGNFVHINPFNQNISYCTVATSDGAGNLTATGNCGGGGTFLSNATSSQCAIPGHCHVAVNVAVNNAQYKAVTWTDSTHLSVIGLSGSGFPAAGTGLNVSVCEPGENVNAITTDILFRFNEFRNATNGPEFANVPSDCGDLSLGLTNFIMHDNLIQGVNNLLNNSSGANVIARCTFVFNGATPTVTNFALNHNTCAMGSSGPFGNSGFDATLDSTDTTTDGSTGAYLQNRIIQNNIGPAGGIFTYSGGLYPGGALAGLKQQSCTPAVTGTTCTWVYTENVFGIGQWTNQTVNNPFPSTNQTCGPLTCFPSGTTFANAFTQYSGSAGQTGYLGNYVLAAGIGYIGAGTDGKDIGVSDWTQFNNKIAGAFSPTTYTAAAISTGSTLPSGIVGNAYSTCLSATSASDFQRFQITLGSLPAGLSLTPSAGQWCIAGTPTVAGSSSFTLQLIDAAQQYASKSFTLSVSSTVNNNWVQVSTPAGATQIRGFAFDGSGTLYLVDRLSGVWSHAGGTWNQVNSGLPAVSGVIIGWNIMWDSTHSQLIIGLAANGSNHVTFWRSSNGGTSWTNIPIPNPSSGNFPSFMPVLVAANGNLIGGVQNGTANTLGAWYSTDGGATTHAASCTANGGTPCSGTYSIYLDQINNAIIVGTESAGIYASTDNGQTYSPISPNESGFGGGNAGNADTICTNASGTIFAAQQRGLWQSSGTFPTLTWSQAIPNSSGAQGRMCFRDNAGNMYYGHQGDTSDNSVLKQSTTGGGVGTWSLFQNGLPISSLGTKGLEGWQMIQNSFDGQLYLYLQNGSTNAGTIWKTQ